MTEEQKPDSEEQGEQPTPRPVAGNPLFSGPVVPTQAVRANGRPVTPAFGNQVAAQPPQQGPPGAGPVQAGSRPDDYASMLSQQLAGQNESQEENQPWYAAGLSAHDGHLIEQCKRHGLTPDDLRVRVDGRTLASRLKNGESVSSVRSRLT